jgi:fanconi anemia group M protein
MTAKKFSITIDMREQRSGLTQRLENSEIVTVQYADLAVGDFLLSDDVVVERKEATDFVMSIFDQRLFSQVAQMKATYLRPIILIEGDIYKTRSAVTPNALRGALSWMSVIEGVNVVHSRDVADSASFLETMARHAQEGLGYEVALRSGKPKNLAVLSQFAVEGLPGCGPTMAKKLLQHFGTVERIFGATTDQLCEVKGVGRKTAEQIRELLTFANK